MIELIDYFFIFKKYIEIFKFEYIIKLAINFII